MDNTEDCIGVPFRDCPPTEEEIRNDQRLWKMYHGKSQSAPHRLAVNKAANEESAAAHIDTPPLGLTHARMARMICLAPCLFRPLKRGQRKQKLHVAYRYNEHIDVEFNAPELLGADDMRMLQVLVALGAVRGETIASDQVSGGASMLRDKLQLGHDSQRQPIKTVEISINELALALGYVGHSGPKYRAIGHSMKRLANVTVDILGENVRNSMNLKSFQAEKQNAITLKIALCPLLLMGIESEHQYTRIDLGETRRIPTEPGRILHQRLCGWIDPGKTRPVGIDTLCDYLWADAASEAVMSNRRLRARKTAQGLEHAYWTIERVGQRQLQITRPYC